MKANMGTADRAIRALVAIVIVALYYTGQLTGLAAIILLIFAGMFLFTSFIRFCPLYFPFGISTRRKKAS